jgi:predicted transcriptional regulator
MALESQAPRVRELFNEGYEKREIADILNIRYSTVKKYLSKRYDAVLEHKAQIEEERKELEKKVIELIPSVKSYHQLCDLLGLSGAGEHYNKLRKIVDDNNIDISHFHKENNKRVIKTLDDDEYFICGKSRENLNTIKRLVSHGYKEYKCEKCGLGNT